MGTETLGVDKLVRLFPFLADIKDDWGRAEEEREVKISCACVYCTQSVTDKGSPSVLLALLSPVSYSNVQRSRIKQYDRRQLVARRVLFSSLLNTRELLISSAENIDAGSR